MNEASMVEITKAGFGVNSQQVSLYFQNLSLLIRIRLSKHSFVIEFEY